MRSGYVSAAEVEARFARDISQLVDISPNLIIDDTAQGPGGVGAHLLWTPRDDLDLEYSYTREEYDQDTPALLNMSQPGQLFCDAFGFCAPDEDTPVSGDRFDLLQGEVLQDWDGVPLTLFETTRPEVYDQTSHELRLTFAGDRLNYVVGAYLFDMEYTIDLVSFIGFAVPNAILDIPQTAHQETDSWALFFEADYALTDALVLTLGGRYTDDEKEAQITNDFFISQPTPVSGRPPTQQAAVAPPGSLWTYTTPRDPRTYGIQVTYDF